MIQDNDLDIENLERCLRRMKIDNPVVRAKDGIEGLDPLRERSPVTGMKRPYIVLLDLNMPRMNGADFIDRFHWPEGLMTSRVALCSGVRSPREVCTRVQGNGVEIPSKDVVFSRAEFLSFLERYTPL